MPVDALRSLRDQLLELSPELAHITGPDGTFVATNARWRQTLGYSPDDLAQLTVFDLVPEEHRARFQHLTARMLQGDDTGIFEVLFRTRDGRDILLEGQGLAHAGEDGRVSIFCTFREPVPRRSGAEQLHAAVALGRAALAEVRDGVVAVDRLDGLTGMNPAAEHLTGLTARDVMGQPCGHVCRLVDELTGEEAASLTAEAMHTGQRQTPGGEVALRLADGTRLSVDATALPLVDATGAVTGAVLVLHDLAESREARRSFRDARAAGARRLDALRLLAGGIAHDLNNALAPIPLIVSNLQEECPERARELDVLAASTDRAVSTVRQLLTFARGASAPPRVIDPHAALGAVTDVVRGTLPADIDVRTVVARDAEPFPGDPAAVQQVLLALCLNARDAMAGGGRLTIAAARGVVVPGSVAPAVPGSEARAGTYARLSVEDTGTGIDADVLDRIFEPFFTTKPDGKGLGLSTVLGIVKGLGGFVQVDTVPGRGTRVSAWFPVQAVDVSRAATER